MQQQKSKASLKEGPSYFQWFYFDAHCSEQTDVVISFHLQPFVSRFEVSILDVFVYKENHPYFHRYLVLPRKALQVNQLNSRIVFDNNQLHLLLEFDQNTAQLTVRTPDLELDLQVRNMHQERKPLRLSLGDQPFFWTLYMPWARASGTLRFIPKSGPQKTIALEGQAYFDGNDGFLNLKKNLKSWLWMKVYLGERLLITGEVLPLVGAKRTFLVEVTPTEIRSAEQSRLHVTPESLQIYSSIGDWQLQIEKQITIDKLSFRVPVWPDWLALPEKIVEILASLTLNFPGLKWLRPWVMNGLYRRERWTARTKDGEKVEIFGEEMILNA